MKISTLLRSTALAFGIIGISATSFANSISFSTSVGVQPGDVGVITLTEVNANTVNILVDLLPGYGFLNTGAVNNGPHTPFAFNLLGTEVGVSISSFIQPVNGIAPKGTFSLNLGGGDNTPYGTYGVAIDYSAGNGGSKAYFGDLEFNLTRTSGLLLTDFVANSGNHFFSADLIGLTGLTGSQAWDKKDSPPEVPDSGASLVLLGLGLSSLALFRRKAV